MRMSEDDIMIGPEDIERDLEGTRKAEARIAAFFRRGEAAGGMRRRGGGPPAPPPAAEAPAGVGRRLVARCPADTQQRYRTLLHFEGAITPDGDFGSLISPACAIVEAELRRLLAHPARPIAGHLVAALSAGNYTQHVEVLRQWERGAKATMGTLCVMLFALRKGDAQKLPEIGRFLADRFRPRFAELLRTRQLDTSLDAIRTRFRNPADHAERVFDAAAYAEFARLVVANRLFAVWDTEGPAPPDPGAGSGVLYHHLQHALDTAPGGQVGKRKAGSP
jgi:hypothetical protein